ncbi:hypothetical protein BH10BAC5_BH10BAC5_24880 [soil metagenome]
MKFLRRFLPKITAVTFLFAILFCSKGYSQIKIYERPTLPDTNSSTSLNYQNSNDLYSTTSTRKLISLNGEWNVSFNDGKTFNSLIIPCSYTEEGFVQFKKKFRIDADTLNKFSFLLVAEGIQYEADIRINDHFIIKQGAASSSIIIPLDDGIITGNNEIFISVNNELSRYNTIPISTQINYGNIYGGINRDIYIVAVPKVYSLRNFISYKAESDGSLNFQNNVSIRSTILSNLTVEGKQFFVQTKVFKKNSGDPAGESAKLPFSIENNNLLKLATTQSIKGIALWTPEDPQLYVIKTFIYSNDEIIDEFINETGFRIVTKKDNDILLNGKDYRLNGINYYEDSYKYGNAISYSDTENDIQTIKKLGFNSIRVPGASPNPYILKLCDRYGLFIFYDLPYNTVPSGMINSKTLKDQILSYLASVVIRDRNSPSIIAWGLANDADVTKASTADYLRSAISSVDTLNKRLTYYTTTNYTSGICDGITDLIGINFYDNDISRISKFTSKDQYIKTKSLTFVSYYGTQTEFNNRNGFSDMHSYEYQSKFLMDAFRLISKASKINLMASFEDWNAQQPLLYHFSEDIDLRKNGLFNSTGEAKQSPEFIRRIIMGEENPRLLEGENHTGYPQIFLVTGIIFMMLLLILFSQYSEFRILVMRAITHPVLFFKNAKDLTAITPLLSLFVMFVISIGMAVFLGNIFFFYREINNFDLLISGFITTHSAKVLIADLLNSPIEFLLIFSLANIIMNLVTCLILYAFSLKSRNRIFLRNIYTVAVWSTIPLLICLPLGTFFIKIMPLFNGFIYVSLTLFAICYIMYLLRLFAGIRIFFEISYLRSYLLGMIFSILVFGSIFLYFKIWSNGFEIMMLILNNLN